MVDPAAPLWGPLKTPPILTRLIAITAGICLFAAITEPLFREIFGWPGLQHWLSLSWYGIQHSYIWQLITYLFVQYNGGQGISFFFLLNLFFGMYFLWLTGSAVVDAVGSRPFLRLYFLSGLFAGCMGLFFMRLIGQYQVLSGPFPAILAVATVWTMLHPNWPLLFLGLFPISTKGLFLILLGLLAAIDISNQAWVDLLFALSGVLFGYFYATLAWDMNSPWSLLHPIDRFLNRIGQKVRNFTVKKGKAEIIDFKTGETQLDDDAFIDAMLAKISKKGEHSLTHQERRRMDAISSRKRKR